MSKAPREPAGTVTRQVKLTPENVLEIFALRPLRSSVDNTFLPSTKFCRELSIKFSVGERTIRDIWNRRSWAVTTRPLWNLAEIAADPATCETLDDAIKARVVPAKCRTQGRPHGAKDTVRRQREKKEDEAAHEESGKKTPDGSSAEGAMEPTPETAAAVALSGLKGGLSQLQENTNLHDACQHSSLKQEDGDSAMAVESQSSQLGRKRKAAKQEGRAGGKDRPDEMQTLAAAAALLDSRPPAPAPLPAAPAPAQALAPPPLPVLSDPRLSALLSSGTFLPLSLLALPSPPTAEEGGGGGGGVGVGCDDGAGLRGRVRELEGAVQRLEGELRRKDMLLAAALHHQL